MSKYDAIRDLLRTKTGEVEILMLELSNRVPGGLPPSAYNWEAWWTNDDDSHVQSRSWGAAGYAAAPDLLREKVRFVPKRA
jgi:hypothetical protein